MGRGEWGAIERGGQYPVTIDSLRSDLLALGLEPGSVVLVHTSLSALGWVSGGPVAIILALELALGPQGTLMMPAHSSDLSDPAFWQNPPVPEAWWPVIRDTMPAYDPDVTPTRGMGVVAETFRRNRGVLRSDHPQLSFAAKGPAAKVITANHPLDDAMGAGSPLDRLYELDGWVLLLGVGHQNNTSLHLAEYRASFPGKKAVTTGAPMMVNGRREWVTIRDLDFNDDDFPLIGAAFEQTPGAVKIGPVGRGTARLMRQRQLVDFATAWMAQNRL